MLDALKRDKPSVRSERNDVLSGVFGLETLEGAIISLQRLRRPLCVPWRSV